MTGNFIAAVFSLAGFFILLCRIDKMTAGVTQGAVFVQHAILALALFGCFLLTATGAADWGAASASGGVLGFFMLSVRRWRDAAPEGTTKPGELGPAELRHISGGKR